MLYTWFAISSIRYKAIMGSAMYRKIVTVCMPPMIVALLKQLRCLFIMSCIKYETMWHSARNIFKGSKKI